MLRALEDKVPAQVRKADEIVDIGHGPSLAARGSPDQRYWSPRVPGGAAALKHVPCRAIGTWRWPAASTEGAARSIRRGGCALTSCTRGVLGAAREERRPP